MIRRFSEGAPAGDGTAGWHWFHQCSQSCRVGQRRPRRATHRFLRMAGCAARTPLTHPTRLQDAADSPIADGPPNDISTRRAPVGVVVSGAGRPCRAVPPRSLRIAATPRNRPARSPRPARRACARTPPDTAWRPRRSGSPTPRNAAAGDSSSAGARPSRPAMKSSAASSTTSPPPGSSCDASARFKTTTMWSRAARRSRASNKNWPTVFRATSPPWEPNPGGRRPGCPRPWPAATGCWPSGTSFDGPSTRRTAGRAPSGTMRCGSGAAIPLTSTRTILSTGWRWRCPGKPADDSVLGWRPLLKEEIARLIAKRAEVRIVEAESRAKRPTGSRCGPR